MCVCNNKNQESSRKIIREVIMHGFGLHICFAMAYRELPILSDEECFQIAIEFPVRPEDVRAFFPSESIAIEERGLLTGNELNVGNLGVL